MKNNSIIPVERRPGADYIHLYLLLGLTLLLSCYYILRYAGMWGETDTSIFSRAINAILDSGKLVPDEWVYFNGYGYQVLVAWLVAFTGLPLSVIQTIGGALLAVWVVIPAWLCYREFTGTKRATAFATLILLVQPEFLFPILRGTHEKFTRGLMFLCLYLLLRGLRSYSIRQLGPIIVCFYLCAFALISLNNLMATSFILSIILALGLLWVVGRLRTDMNWVGLPLISKLINVAVTLLVIAYIFTFYIYSPAEWQLLVLKSVWERLSLLFLNLENKAINPYGVVNSGWINLPVYFMVSLANWILLGLSILIWVKQSYSWLIKRSRLPSQKGLALWGFYAANAFLGGSSILVDMSGALSANLQHRIYPSFAMLAAPLVGEWLARETQAGILRYKMTKVTVGLLLSCLMVLSVFKATTEPLLSNYWSFYTSAERASLAWAERSLNGQRLWAGPGGRLSEAYTIYVGSRPLYFTIEHDDEDPQSANFMISTITRLHAIRLGFQLPDQADNLLIYDNGQAQIYQYQTTTPFQK